MKNYVEGMKLSSGAHLDKNRIRTLYMVFCNPYCSRISVVARKRS